MRWPIVKIIRDAQTTVNRRAMPPWEVPVVEHVFGEGNVEETGDFDFDGKDDCTPHAEFERLVKAYGNDPADDTPFVASVYGQGRIGLRELTKAMDAAKRESEAAQADDPLLA